MLYQKLKSLEVHSNENISDFDESEMSEISVEDEVDCSSFVKNIDEPKRNLIFEDSIEFKIML